MATATLPKTRSDGYAVNHCGAAASIREAKMSPSDVREAVMDRVHELVTAAQGGKPGKPHPQPGIELIANHVATQVIAEGARQIANDVDVDLERLVAHAKSNHISYC